VNILAGVTPLLASSCWLLCALVWGFALYKAPWKALARVSARQHLLLGAVLFQGCFWLLNVEIRDSLALHPLAMTAMVMVFGWSLATLAGSLAMLVSLALDMIVGGTLSWASFPVDIVFSVVLPASASFAVLLGIQRIRLRNLFIYMLGGGFFGAMISIQVMAGGAVLLLHLCRAHELAAVVEEHYLIFLLLMFPEGFINGAIMSMLTVFWPDIVKTFDDHRYLDP